ncbi:MAG: phage protein GemA/Gp16 family protein [Thermodesulfobacteriota bacterium]
MNSDWRRSMVAKVKIAQKQLGLSDEDYRAMLAERYGVESSTKLTMRQLDGLVRFLASRGFQERTVRARKGDKSVPSEKAMNAKAMLSKVEALLAEIGARENRHVPWDYAASILKRMFKVDKLEWAKPDQLRAVIAALHRKAYGATPEEVVQSLISIRIHGGDFDHYRDVLLSQLGPRKRAKAEKLLAGRLEALNESSIQAAPVKQKG